MASLANAVPIVADLVALPAAAGTCNLTGILPPAVASQYANPDGSLLRPDDPAERAKLQKRAGGGHAPRARVLASTTEYHKLVVRMREIGMIEFTSSPKCINGLFGVPKGTDKIRLIVDARPANLLFIDSPPVRLPTPDVFADLRVDHQRGPLFVGKLDLDNFYHRLSLPAWLRPYLALPAVPAGAVGAPGAPTDLVYPMFTTLPMGFSHAVYLAQIAHEHLLDTCVPSFSAVDRVRTGGDPRVDRMRHAVYIDDIVVLGHDESQVRRAMQQYIDACPAHGLLVPPPKIVWPSAEGVECLGLEIHGTDLTVCVLPSKLAALRRDTWALLRRGMCSGLELQQLMGRWTWACLVRRHSLSAFNSVYRFSRCAGRNVYTLWNSVRNELAVAIGLAPLLISTINTQRFPSVLATDASMTGGAFVSARLPAELQEQSVCVVRDGVVGCVSSHQSLRDRHILAQPLGRNIEQLSPSDSATFTPFPWRTIVSHRWQWPAHINLLELASVFLAVKWVSTHNTYGDRVTLLTDSTVTLFAVRKGRSSSLPVLRQLRRIGAVLIAGAFRLEIAWLPSSSNPADAPSRVFARPTHWAPLRRSGR